MKNVITALMTAHLIYYMNQNELIKELIDGIPSLAIAIVLGIILVISDYS